MDGNMDLFRKLTQPLLVIIVSFLPFKQAARTCVLSKQWQTIWRETTNIEFNENFFVNPSESEENQCVQRRDFINFIKQFILTYPDTVIRKFALVCSKPENFLQDMQTFAKFAVSRSVRELELDFSNPEWEDDVPDESHRAVFELPVQVYQHRELESLRMCSCIFDASKFTKFNVLRSLSLEWTKISSDALNALLKGCPLLETLSIKKCWSLWYLEFCIPNLSLKSLVLDRNDLVQDWISIDSPRLKYFKYSGKVGHFHLENQRYMDEAELDFGMEDQLDEIGSLLYDLLQELFSVKILTVCSVLLQIIPHGEEPMGLQIPLNVNHLILNTALDMREFCGLKFMFRSCPILQTLTINLQSPVKLFPDYYPPYPFQAKEFWTKNLVIEDCIKRTLKVVNVMGFKGTLNESLVLRYIIHFGAALEQVNLYISNEGDRNVYLDIAERIVNYDGKASDNVVIAII